MEGQNSQSSARVSQCLPTSSEQNGHVPALSSAQPVLQYGNPYSTQEIRGYYSTFLLWATEMWRVFCTYITEIIELPGLKNIVLLEYLTILMFKMITSHF